MNTYKKYCPNVFIAQCEEAYQKGDTITLTTKYGKENEHIVHNLLFERDGFFFYSITREDGFNSQERAMRKAERLREWGLNASNKSDAYYKTSHDTTKHIPMGQPILVGHHSEKRHRRDIEKSWNALGKSVELQEKAEGYENRAAYWEKLANKIDLSMPESIEFFEQQLQEAIAYQSGLKDGSIPRKHSYSLTYATKKVKELKDKYETAIKLWAD